MLIKENMPLIIIAFSIHGLFVKKDKIRWAVIPGILALISFYLLVFVFIPHISGRPIGEGNPYYIGNNYKNLGGSMGGILCTIIFHPVRTLYSLMTSSNLYFLIAIFNPILYLPLGAPGVLFLISPIFFQHLLSSSLSEHFVHYAYVMTMAPFLFLAAVQTLRFFHKDAAKMKIILAALLFINIAIFPVNFDAFKERFLTGDLIECKEGSGPGPMGIGAFDSPGCFGRGFIFFFSAFIAKKGFVCFL